MEENMDLIKNSDDDLIRSLAHRGVSDVKRLKRRVRANLHDTGAFILTSDKQTLPERIKEHDGPSTHNKEAYKEDDEEEIIMKVTHPTDENAQGLPHVEELSPLFALFPDLITTYPMPESLQSGNISTTDVTRELVALGTKADFSRLKPSSRLIPPRKVWLSALHEVPREIEKMEELEGEMSDEDLGKLHFLHEKGLSLESSSSF